MSLAPPAQLRAPSSIRIRRVRAHCRRHAKVAPSGLGPHLPQTLVESQEASTDRTILSRRRGPDNGQNGPLVGPKREENDGIFTGKAPMCKIDPWRDVCDPRHRRQTCKHVEPGVNRGATPGVDPARTRSSRHRGGSARPPSPTPPDHRHDGDASRSLPHDQTAFTTSYLLGYRPGAWPALGGELLAHQSVKGRMQDRWRFRRRRKSGESRDHYESINGTVPLEPLDATDRAPRQQP